ncbi:HlyD family type I secretion periplasmic adaptor subunit [Brucella anthropi]|uniref:HlyD family type I secretion periplasmic adaptor subunit n=1 Tax=Brucella anthropi TaxID=529 RepID=UPI00296F503F|nr:HlyD family type I secretion periplasmic adaptor subunit [Ochrobactrum sp. MYb49]
MEFLPAALEILETPASPIRIALVWFVCTLATIALLWSWFGKFDTVATAQGKVQPAGRVKIIESLESGKTKSIPVKNGDLVEAGTIVVELDDDEIRADETAKRGNLNALKAEVIRRSELLDELSRWQGRDIWKQPNRNAFPTLTMPAGISNPLHQREQSVFEAELRGIMASLDSLVAQRIQRQAEINGLEDAIIAQAALAETLSERVSMRSKLLLSSSGSRAQVIDAMQVHQEAVSSLADKRAQLKTARAAFDVATAEGTKMLHNVASENATRKLEAERNIDELEQEVRKAERRRELMTIKSPIKGTVQLSAITTIGQVVASGTELMRIVPNDAPLEIEAFLPNKDIGFVASGQSAIIKIEAYPFTRFGILEGHVTHVSSDAVPEPDAQQMESTVSQNARSTVPTGNVPRVQNLVFPVTIALSKTTLSVDGRPTPLSPGMGATVEIRTGQRRILEYLFSPIAQIASEAMGER